MRPGTGGGDGLRPKRRRPCKVRLPPLTGGCRTSVWRTVRHQDAGAPRLTRTGRRRALSGRGSARSRSQELAVAPAATSDGGGGSRVRGVVGHGTKWAIAALFHTGQGKRGHRLTPATCRDGPRSMASLAGESRAQPSFVGNVSVQQFGVSFTSREVRAVATARQQRPQGG